MTIYDIILFSPFVLFACLLWKHGSLSIAARAAAKRYCDEQGVQFLDQNVLLKKVSIGRSKESFLALRRTYRFEFSTLGDRRYKGTVCLLGQHVEHIELEPFKTS